MIDVPDLRTGLPVELLDGSSASPGAFVIGIDRHAAKLVIRTPSATRLILSRNQRAALGEEEIEWTDQRAALDEEEIEWTDQRATKLVTPTTGATRHILTIDKMRLDVV